MKTTNWTRVVTAISSAALVGATLTAAAPAAPTVQVTGSSFSDQELVLALVYGTGPLAEAVGTRLDEADLGSQAWARRYEAHAAQDAVRLLEEEAALAPVLDSLRSGSAYEVEAAFTSMQPIVQRHFERGLDAEGLTAGDLETGGPKTRCGAAVVCVAYAMAAVHNMAVVTAAAAVVVAAALWCGAWKWCSRSMSATATSSDAAREQLVVAVRDALHEGD